jgi:hypothetical protein
MAWWDFAPRLGVWTMFVTRLKQFGGLALVAVSLAACGGPGAEEFDQIAKKNSLNKTERVALEACYKAMSGTKPILKIGSKEQMMSDVPMDVCVCQSRTMAALFQEGQYKSYDRFTKWMTKLEKKRLPGMSRDDLKKGLDKKTSAKKLIASFEGCAQKYVAENRDKESFKNFLLPPPAKKPKKGEEKQASKS